jgi:geranylgeranylglycerol-phosphate geranylgeranyltransferase
MKDYIKLIRPVNCIMAAIAVYIGSIVAGSFAISQSILYGMLSVFFICGAGMIVNDYFDINIDKVNKPKRPLASGSVSKHFAILYAIILYFIGNFLAFNISAAALYIAIAASVLLFAYGWKLKKTLLIGNLLVSFLVGLTFIYGGVIAGNYLLTAILGLLALLSNMGREIFKSIDDMEGDRKNYVKSLPLKIGAKPAKIVASVFVFIAVILSFLPFAAGMFGVPYLLVIFVADIIFIVAILFRKDSQAKLCKYAMIIAMIAFLIGSVVK